MKKSKLKPSKNINELFLKFLVNKLGGKYLVIRKYGNLFKNNILLNKTLTKILEKDESKKLEFFHFLKIFLNKNSLLYKGVNNLQSKLLFKIIENQDTEHKFLKFIKKIDGEDIIKKFRKNGLNNNIFSKNLFKQFIVPVHQKILGLYNGKTIYKNDIKNFFNNQKNYFWTIWWRRSKSCYGYQILLNFYKDFIKHYLNNNCIDNLD